LPLISSLCFAQVLPKPKFSIPAGFYPDSISVVISTTVSGSQIRFTLNGSEPTATSQLYSTPVKIKNRSHKPNDISTIKTNPSSSYPHPGYDQSRADSRGWLPPFDTTFKATVLKARVFKSGFTSDSSMVATYLIKEGTTTMFTLPVISISLDSLDLFGYVEGMYVYGRDSVDEGNYNIDTVEKKAYIEFFEYNGFPSFSQYGKIKNHGNGGRHAPQKSLQLKAESDYGKGFFKNKLFPNSEVTKHDRLLLRNGGHRPDCIPRDDVGQDLFKNLENISQSNRHCIVLLNGEYWGVQTLKEMQDNNYFLRKYNIPKANCVILQQTGSINEGVPGDDAPYNGLLGFFSSNSMANAVNWAHVNNEMDMESFTDFECAEIFIGNGDWPNNNTKFWRYKRATNDLSLNNHLDGRWRWMIYDLDASFGGDCSGIYPSFNALANAMDPSFNNYTLPLRSLMANPQYKIDFINRYADLLNSNFLASQLQNSINKVAGIIGPEMPKQVARWRYPSVATNLIARNTETPTLNKWNTIVTGMLDFANKRANKTRKNFLNYFLLADTVKITLNVNDTLRGKVRINTLFLDKYLIRNGSAVYPWTGTYFDGNPVTMEAIAYPGFKFSHWNNVNDTVKCVTKNVTSDTSVTAYFIPDPTFRASDYLYINEVLAINSANITDAYLEHDIWLELYNPNTFSVDVAGFYLSDAGTNKKKFQVKRTSQQTIIKPNGFLLLWMDHDTLQGNLHCSFKPVFGGDSIYLTLPNGIQTVNSVLVQNQTANISYGREVDGAAKWISWNVPTPNASNKIAPVEKVKSDYLVYPNPTSGELNITSPTNCFLFDILGRKYGEYRDAVKIDISELAQGIYFLKMESGEIFKIVKVK
jgi:hypothetical protein